MVLLRKSTGQKMFQQKCSFFVFKSKNPMLLKMHIASFLFFSSYKKSNFNLKTLVSFIQKFCFQKKIYYCVILVMKQANTDKSLKHLCFENMIKSVQFFLPSSKLLFTEKPFHKFVHFSSSFLFKILLLLFTFFNFIS